MTDKTPLPRCESPAVFWHQTGAVQWHWCADHLPGYCDTWPLEEGVTAQCDYRFVVLRSTRALDASIS